MSLPLRLIWKLYRFELLTTGGLTLLLAIAAAGLGTVLDGMRPDMEVLESCTILDDVPATAECDQAMSWLAMRHTELGRLIGAMPFIVGAVLGSALVSAEIEHRTAQLGWTLAGSRTRWLLDRLLPVGAFSLAILIALALAAQYLEAARQPGIDPFASLHDYGHRSSPIVMRGLALFACAVLIGSVIGRQLPSLVVAGGLAVALAYGLAWTFPFGAQWTWIADEASRAAGREISDVFGGDGFRDDDGALLTYRQATARAPARVEDPDDWVYQNFSPEQEVLEGPIAPEVEAREAVALAALTVTAMVGTLVVLARRRPY